MTDPWARFAATTGGSEFAGYFEQRDIDRPDRARALSYLRADEHVSVRTSSDLTRLRRETDASSGGRERPWWVGYLGFDAFHLFEPLADPPRSGSPFPLGEFVRVADAELERFEGPRWVPLGRRRENRVPSPEEDTLSRTPFCQGVEVLRGAIRDGEAFQVVLSHRRRWSRPPELLGAAGRLRRHERFAFFYYLRFGDRELIGATPESVLSVSGRRATVHPIAGTRPSAISSGARLPLREDPKELAEHRMLVDLGRNDLGRVARVGSVRVRWTERTLRFARLEHLVSCVEGVLDAGTSPWVALGATFPAGTVSGAPKIRATRLLRGLERTWRGPYAGAVGILRPPRTARWALAIRGAFAARDALYTAAGAGIVWPSTPDREYGETLTKLAEVESAFLGTGAP